MTQKLTPEAAGLVALHRRESGDEVAEVVRRYITAPETSEEAPE